MKKEDKKLIYLLLRYLSLVLIALVLLPLAYPILLNVTIYSSNFLINLVTHSQVNGSIISVGEYQIEIVSACVASSAYFLLVLLNLSSSMTNKKRLLSIAFSLVLFLLVNVVRIFIFSLMYINNFRYFDITHLVFWYIVSGVIVFLVWIATIKAFKIRGIPFYSDLKEVYSNIKK